MMDILFSPLKAIAAARAKKNINNTALVLVIASFLCSLNIFIIKMSEFSIQSYDW